jgi:hypothetical protein
MMTLRSISSGASNSGSSSSRSTTTSFTLSTSRDSISSDHRFYAIDHPDPIALQRFDPTLVPSLVSGNQKDEDDTTNVCWIAVYRNPHYVVRRTSSSTGESRTSAHDYQRRQELFQAMKIATDPNTYNNNNDDDNEENDDATTTKNEKREESSVLSASVTALKWADTLQISPPPTTDMMDVPIAVARLYPSTIHSSSSNSNSNNRGDNDNPHQKEEEEGSTSTSTPTRSTTKQTWIVDSLRCSLPKELTNPECDGGSEYLEAIGVAVDASLMRIFRQLPPPYPQGNQEEEEKVEPQSSSRLMTSPPPSPPPPVVFDGSIRVKSTIYTRTVLEQRGFRPVESLSRDMATHYFCRDTCLQMYTQRIKNRTNHSDNNNDNNDANTFLSPVARSISHSIVSLLQSQLEYLGTIPPEADAAIASSKGDEERNDLDEPIMDPWAGIKMQL